MLKNDFEASLSIKTIKMKNLKETPPSKQVILTGDGEILTKKEAAALLKINLSTLNSWINKKILKVYAIGGRRYLNRTQISEALVELKPTKS